MKDSARSGCLRSNRSKKAQLCPVVLVLALCGSVPARADVAPPGRTEYTIKVDETTVKIYLSDNPKPCSGASGSYGVVRENIQTGEVYQLPFYCESDTDGTQALVDYCVPQGKYRYGLLKPLPCGSDYYNTAEVTGASACSKDPRPLPPKKDSAPPPWHNKARYIPCDYDEDGCAISSGVSAGGAAQVGLGVLLVLLLLAGWRRSA